MLRANKTDLGLLCIQEQKEDFESSQVALHEEYKRLQKEAYVGWTEAVVTMMKDSLGESQEPRPS